MTPQQYQLFPALTTSEYAALKADIAERGVMVPVELDEHGNILDGHHRVRAWTELRAEGVKVPDYPRMVRTFADEDAKIEHVLTLNLARRHLTPEQRTQLEIDLRQRGWSFRRIAEKVGVSHETVRMDLSTVNSLTVELPTTVIGQDGKRRAAARPEPPPSIFAKDTRETERATAAAGATRGGCGGPTGRGRRAGGAIPPGHPDPTTTFRARRAMARIRSLKPEFFKSLTLSLFARDVRFTFAGLWCYADDYGRGRDDPRLIKAEVWPVDDDIDSGVVREHLRQLSGAALVCRYRVAGRAYFHLTNWDEHQKISHPAKSPIPACPKPHHGGGPDPLDTADQPQENRRSDAGDSPESLRSDAGDPPNLARARGAGSLEGNREPGAGSREPDGSAGRAQARAREDSAKAPTAKQLTAEHLARCKAPPPKAVRDRTGREVAKLLTEGVAPDAIRAGLELLRIRAKHPSLLAALVNEHLNPPASGAGVKHVTPPAPPRCEHGHRATLCERCNPVRAVPPPMADLRAALQPATGPDPPP